MEPLTGRKWTYILYPVSYGELKEVYQTPFELSRQLEDRLVFGSYPELFNIENREERKKYLEDIARSSLYKDILTLTDVKNPSALRKLLKLLAFQIGSQVSLSELATQLGIRKETVNRYIDLLEQSFIIFRLSGFSRNLRKEVSKMDKIYFYDVGVRNTLIGNLDGLAHRRGHGPLFENFLIAERMKKRAYEGALASQYFWRTYTGAELDLVEEGGGRLYGYEFTYGRSRKKRVPATWLQTYDGASFRKITEENYLEFIA